MESGGPPLQIARCYCRAAMFRAALSTIEGWDEQLLSLRFMADDLLPLIMNMVGNDTLAPPFWDTPPYVLNLSRCFRGSDKAEMFLAPLLN